MPVFSSSPERLSLDRGWHFHSGDIPFPKLKSHSDSYSNAKAGRTFGAAAPEHDDTAWREVTLPHDWAIESGFDPEENLSQGFRSRGFGWYRRHFRLDELDRGQHIELQFDGVATHCTVWVNGSVVHRNWCGYTSFQIDLTPFARYGEELNTIAVRVDAEAMEGWWYEGAGIYRHTWLVKRASTHLITDGVWANPIREADGAWFLPVETIVESSGKTTSSVEVHVALFDPDGSQVCEGQNQIAISPLERAVIKLTLPVVLPRLWSVENPDLYQVRTSLICEGVAVDSLVTSCGFRTLRFEADSGFFLNDHPLKLKGVCNHQDHAGVGVAMPDSLWEFRVRRLKEMGVNAYRCAHNPPSVEFLDLCDRHGILVMDETRHFNSNPEYLRQLEWLIQRDRNHPSIILWSVFNEEPMQGTEIGFEMVRRMVAAVRRLDSTRPITAAMNGGLFSPINVSQAVDVVGFNYQIESYDRFHEENPHLPMTSAEDTSAFMTRGEYITREEDNIRDSNDTQFAPWGASHRDAWKAIAERAYLAGGFVWTGFDYHGEPTPHQWPSTSSFFGCMDLCGFPKTAFYLHQAHWVEDRPILQLIPHWNWEGQEGMPISVMAISNCETVSLSLNGKPLGEKTVDKYAMVSWEIPYVPGRLEAVACRNGQEIAHAAVETTGEPVALHLVPDRDSLSGNGRDAQPITVRCLDAEGRAVPTAHFPVKFTLEGPGRIIGLGNGDPNCHEPEKGNCRSLFNGLAQVIIQSDFESSGSLRLLASAEGMVGAGITIDIMAVAAEPFVLPAQQILYLQGWRMSPQATSKPDPNIEVADNDMNTWPGVQPGELQSFAHGNWAIYRLKFEPFASVKQAGGLLVFKSITGRAEIWVDQKLLGTKESMESAPLSLKLPAGEGSRTISILIETRIAVPAGLDGVVIVHELTGQ